MGTPYPTSAPRTGSAPQRRVGEGMENREREEREEPKRETTSPSQPTHEATRPSGNPDRDEDAIKEAEERLEQAGGGH